MTNGNSDVVYLSPSNTMTDRMNDIDSTDLETRVISFEWTTT